MVATLWLLSLLTITLIRASECVYAAPPLVKYRRLDNTPFGFQDVYMPEKRTKTSLSIIAPLDVLRQRLLLEIARRQMRENSIQAQKNREILRNIGKRSSGNERPSELERFEPYQQHVDLDAIVNRIAAAATQPNDRFYYFNMQAPDYTFDDTNEMNTLQMSLSRFHHPFQRTSALRLNVDGDNQADPSTNSDDNEQAWHELKQSEMHMKQQPFMNGHHSLFRQLNQQIEEKAANSMQHHRQQQQQQQQQEQPDQEQQQQHEKQQDQKQPLKSYDNNGEFIQSLDLN